MERRLYQDAHSQQFYVRISVEAAESLYRASELAAKNVKKFSIFCDIKIVICVIL